MKKLTLEIQKNLKGFFEMQKFIKTKNSINNQMNTEFYKYHVRKIQYRYNY